MVGVNSWKSDAQWKVMHDGPRITGDGYYESVALDPDGERIDLTTMKT
jgi:hypothetical protein